MATCIWIRTALSDSPQKRLTWRCCLIHLNSLWEASHKFFKRLKQNFHLKYFLGDNRNAIQIQIWVSLIAWLLMQVVKKQVSKKKWSLSNLMTVVHILLNSYVNLYNFLNLPEGQWLKIIKNRSLEEDIWFIRHFEWYGNHVGHIVLV